MDKIWANRLIAGTKEWAEMPASRRAGVKQGAWQEGCRGRNRP